MVFALGLLLWYLHSGDTLLVKLALVFIVITLVIPAVVMPISYLWYGVSHVMGAIMSRGVLTVIYFCIVTPIGVVRRVMVKKNMQAELWKKNSESVFTDRNHSFTRSDIKNPF